jgi:hypothetical protein
MNPKLISLIAAAIFVTRIAVASSALETAVLKAVRNAQFDQVIDFGPANAGVDIKPGSAKRIAHTPTIDVAVIQLDARGKAVACANVLLSRDYPDGLVVPVGWSTGASAVRFRRWDTEHSNGGAFEAGHDTPETVKGWTNQPPLTDADDIVPGRTNAPHQFMAPYPASLFKLLVAFHVMRMADAGLLALDAPFTYSAPPSKPETRSIRTWLDPMITVSDNRSASALLQLLHQKGQIDPMNGAFRDLGLGTLQINGTNPADGRNWQPGEIHMTAFDTARLLWLIDGAPGALWLAPNGQAVTASVLTSGSRAFLKRLLLEQALNEALSTSNLAGAPNVRPGIPSEIAARWINPTNGMVVVNEVSFGVDVRASNARAEVIFAHKSGLTYNYASDAGIVTSLPGKPFRHYIIVFLSNLGYRYTDEAFANRSRGPYADPIPIAYTQRIPALGKAIDDAVQELSADKGRRP